MHYAEVPIPTTEVQGAFSVSIRDVGACTNDRDLLESTINFGRIGALNSHPLQIKCKRAWRVAFLAARMFCYW